MQPLALSVGSTTEMISNIVFVLSPGSSSVLPFRSLDCSGDEMPRLEAGDPMAISSNPGAENVTQSQLVKIEPGGNHNSSSPAFPDLLVAYSVADELGDFLRWFMAPHVLGEPVRVYGNIDYGNAIQLQQGVALFFDRDAPQLAVVDGNRGRTAYVLLSAELAASAKKMQLLSATLRDSAHLTVWWTERSDRPGIVRDQPPQHYTITRWQP